MAIEEFAMKQQNCNEGWWSFLELCGAIKKEDELNELFDLFLTMEEKKDIADRYLIVRDLLKGDTTQRKMANVLHVSIAKITRGSNFLKGIDKRLRSFLTEKMA